MSNKQTLQPGMIVKILPGSRNNPASLRGQLFELLGFPSSPSSNFWWGVSPANPDSKASLYLEEGDYSIEEDPSYQPAELPTLKPEKTLPNKDKGGLSLL